MNMLKEMAEEVVVREVIFGWFEMEPDWEQAGFSIGKIAGKIINCKFSLINWANEAKSQVYT